MSTPSQQPLKEEEEFSNPYDTIAETDGEFPLVDEKMQKILAELLDAEADALGADLREFTADFSEQPFDEEEFMSHIPFPNMIEGGYDDPSLNPQEAHVQEPQPAQKQSQKQPQKQQEKPQQSQKQSAPKPKANQESAIMNTTPTIQDDNDGFVTVGKGGKALKNKKNQKALKAHKAILNGGEATTNHNNITSTTTTTTSNGNNKPNQLNKNQNNNTTTGNNNNNNNAKKNKKQSTSQQQQGQQEQQVFESHKAAAAEYRPKMPGQSDFPFCFVCAKRHDFGECR